MMTDALTADELHAMDLTAELMNTLARVVGNGRTRDQDVSEIAGHIHVVQHLVLAQAAARCYPDRFRLLGESSWLLAEPRQETLSAVADPSHNNGPTA